jgi:hypothetical protein
MSSNYIYISEYKIKKNELNLKVKIETNNKVKNLEFKIFPKKYSIDEFNKLRKDNFCIFIPKEINNGFISGYQINFKIKKTIDNYDPRYDIHIQNFYYNHKLNLLDNSIPNNLMSVIWIVVNSMIIQYCNLPSYNVIGFMANKEERDFNISGNILNTEYSYFVETYQFSYSILEFNNSEILREDKIFIPLYIKNNNIFGYIINTVFDKKFLNDILYKSIDDYPFDINIVSSIQYMLIKGCINTVL